MHTLDIIMFILCTLIVIFISGCTIYSNVDPNGSKKIISNFLATEGRTYNKNNTNNIYNTNIANTTNKISNSYPISEISNSHPISEISNLNNLSVPEDNIKLSRRFDSLLIPSTNMYPKTNGCYIIDSTKGSSHNVSF
jgi:hypothetical protein